MLFNMKIKPIVPNEKCKHRRVVKIFPTTIFWTPVIFLNDYVKKIINENQAEMINKKNNLEFTPDRLQ